MSGKIRGFLSRPLGRDEIAFLYLGYADVILRLEDKVAAFDIANLLGNSEITDLSRLDILAFTHSHGIDGYGATSILNTAVKSD